jgi:hypothetical protein
MMKLPTMLKYLGAALALGAVVGFSVPTYANVYSFSTPPGATSFDGLPLDATATFTTSLGNIEIVLTNNQATFSASQLLSDVSFTASGTTSIVGTGSILPTTASYINLTGCGAPPCLATRSSAGAQTIPWSFTSLGGGDYHFTGLGNPGATGLIIGPATVANSSINGPTHQPYIDGTATFNLSLLGVTADTVISNVSFSFGTNEETVVQVPIPAAVWLFGSGLLGLIGIARRRHAGVATSSSVAA